MKRVGHIYEQLLDREYIKQTIILASKHKTKRKGVIMVMDNLDFYVDKIHEMIVTQNIQLLPTRTRKIRERGKERIITISPFYPNQILDYLLTETVKPVIRKSMYEYSIGNIDKKGISYGKNYLDKRVRKYAYYLKLDIHHFYQSVNTAKLIKLLQHKIKDKRYLNFARQVINPNELPIGCYYSQWLSNYYLTFMDYYIKQVLNIPIYVRYVDDMLLLSNNKRQLMMSQYEIIRQLADLDLHLKRKEQVERIVKRKISFLGFLFDFECTMLRKAIYKKITITVRKLKQHVCASLVKRLISYWGWIKGITYGYHFYRKFIYPIIKIGELRKYIESINQIERVGC